MSLRRLIVLSISAAALGYTAMPTVQAAFQPGPGSVASPKSMIVTVQKKPKGKATCGAYMYWSAKEKKCMDARLKKSTKPWSPF